MEYRKSFWCWFGLHRWDVAMLKCSDCGKPDKFLERIVHDAFNDLKEKE